MIFYALLNKRNFFCKKIYKNLTAEIINLVFLTKTLKIKFYFYLKAFMTKTKNKSPAGHHDIFFKACYSNPRFALELLQLALSKEELDVFDWNGLKSEKDTFQDLRADLVFSVPFKNKPGRKAKLCLLLEHKSRFSRRIYHQILKYKTLIIGQSLEKTEDDCLVIAIVFYHGKEPWKWAKSLKKGLWGRILPEIPSSLEKDVLDYGMRVLDTHDPQVEKAIGDRDFKSRGFLSALKGVWSLKAEERGLKEAVSLFDNWTGDREDLALSVGDYFWSSVPGMTKELWEKLEREAVSKGIFSKGGYMNIREYIKEEGRQEGRQEGIQKGIQKGIQAGIQEGIQKGIQEGKRNREREVILNMLRNNLDMPLICKVTGLSEEEIKKIQSGS